ncbi:MAG: VOC family protein [Pseudomonadota bacterium]
MFDHITIGVLDAERALAFYDRALEPLGFQRLVDLPLTETDGVRVCAYGADRPQFWLAEEKPTQGLMHIAFVAKNRAAVDTFYTEALNAGGKDNGPPGPRPHYHEDYYAAYVFDPEGHNIEAVCYGS